MRWIAPYLALLIFPLSVFLPFNWVRFVWGFQNGLAPMTPEVLRRAEKVDLFVWPLRDTTVVCLVVLLMHETGVTATQVGIHGASWRIAVGWGAAAGLLLIATQGLLWALNPSLGSLKPQFEIPKGPFALWCLIYLVGAMSEELWLVVSLVALRSSGHSATVSILLTSIACGAAHFTYRTGALAVAMSGMVSCLLFLATGSLLASYLFHYLGNLGSLYWLRRRADWIPASRGWPVH